MRGSVPFHFCLQKWKVLLPKYSELPTPSTAAQQVQFGHLWNPEDMLYVEWLSHVLPHWSAPELLFVSYNEI